MYNPENEYSTLFADIEPLPDNKIVNRGLLQGRAARLIATTLLASAALIGVSAETESTSSGSTTTSAAAHCDYMPGTHHQAATTSPSTAKEIGHKMVSKCFGSSEWWAAKDLWEKESSWDPMAQNPNGGACSIAQAWPCSKFLNSVGKSRLRYTTVEEQIHWGINYILSRPYNTPTKALQFWKERHPINGRDVGNWY